MAVSVSSAVLEIGAQNAIALRLPAGRRVRIIDPMGEQVADVALFDHGDPRDAFSPGRTIDYNSSIRVGLGDVLYSQRGIAFARVVEDDTGVHDLLLAPCSKPMYERRGEYEHPSCHANLARALSSFGIAEDAVTATLNVFMDVRVAEDGGVTILAPRSRPGDAFTIEAVVDLVVGIAACSSEITNNGRCKPIRYELGLPPAR